MSAKLLTLLLCLVGIFPQTVCRCAPVASPRGPECRCKHCQPEQHPAPDHDRHCPNPQLESAWQAMPPAGYEFTAPEALPGTCGLLESADAGVLVVAPLPERPPPAVPLFLSLRVLRN